MKSTKIMLSGIMLMLLAFCAFIIDSSSHSWVAGAAVILMPLSIIVFVIGLAIKD
ncbi:hypothetical protein GMD88_14685 [Pseudoflavonifractor sp. BIOML-A6]|nr:MULTISPECIES: hypothetical protein [unclassified Pseudoflavonifractor]MTQ98333.1 hypothetical protein [Pseudoflavonifractor sp. BIOML-A16]MTR07683.1 hypothetical protein [Pseudoflavonifractor sp. BIOML-A15]MTR33834.1 hypothetical protein [Pseudoflavonifractor sp. BIOML-A14]MTR36737.1 hypothetical protein [Pseudoflavonifractor sp. BIOML-A9]MTR73917.1 hypothetical protein [Pseudoflavonifractor sp. BIOML-A18]MTS64694.1 hypothetical protein [Pseudoflavonifractor sp. BIOML-A5]MTS72511.1 hypoth